MPCFLNFHFYLWILTFVNVLDHQALRHSHSILLKSDRSLNFNNDVYFIRLIPFRDNLLDHYLGWRLTYPLPRIKLLWKGSFLWGHIAFSKEWPWPSSRMSLQIYFSLQQTIYEALYFSNWASFLGTAPSLRGQPSGNHPLGKQETIWLVPVQLLSSYVTLGSKSLSFTFLIFKIKQLD